MVEIIKLDREQLLQAQKQIMRHLVVASAELEKIQTLEGTILEKWQHMIGIVLPIQYDAVAELGLPKNQNGLTSFNEQLMTACLEDVELAAQNGKKWDFIFRTAFDLKEVTELTLDKAQSLIRDIVLVMTSEDFLERIDKNMETIQVEVTPVVRRQKLLEILLPLHLDVLEKHGFKGDRGYLQMQRGLMDHFHDSFIAEQSKQAQRVVFARAGLLENEKS